MIGDNIKALRKSLCLTQAQFAEKIGIRQSTIAMAESNKTSLSRQALMAISREFGVRLEWLETGEGEMYSERDTSILAKLEASGSLTPKGRELIEIFLRMPPATQDLIANAIAEAAKYFSCESETRNVVPMPTRKPDNELTREEMHAALDAELDARDAARKRATSTSSASTGSSGSLKRYGNSP